MKPSDLFKTTEASNRQYVRIPKLSGLSNSPLAYSLAFRLKMSLEFFPSLSIGSRRLLHRGHPSVRKYVTSKHRIVIDGYPRSGNSFSRVRFLLANPELEDLFANHIHLPSQIIKATDFELPTAFLIRNPRDVILSFTVFQMSSLKQKSAVPAVQQLRMNALYYYQFHRRVLARVNKIVVAPFEVVISDYDRVIAEVNRRFSSSFNLPSSVSVSDEEIFKAVPEHLSPSLSRERMKEELKISMGSSRLSSLFEKCDHVYSAIIQHSPFKVL